MTDLTALGQGLRKTPPSGRVSPGFSKVKPGDTPRTRHPSAGEATRHHGLHRGTASGPHYRRSRPMGKIKNTANVTHAATNGTKRLPSHFVYAVTKREERN